MKKVLLFLLLTVFCFSKPYSTSEKQVILKQFQELQSAVKSKDKNKILSYINFPISMYGTGEKITKKEFTSYYEEPFKYIDMLKINNSEIIPISEYILDSSEEGGNYYLGASGAFIEKSNSDVNFIYDLIPSYKGNGLLVQTSTYDDMTDGSMYYIFDLINGKLKLVGLLQLP